MRSAPLVVWLVAAALLSAAGLRGQPQGSGVLVLDFLASDRAGQPVTDLAAGEVTLRVGGRARPLLSLEHVGSTDVPRDIALLVDEPTLFGLEPVVRDAADALIRSLSPSDRLSYLNTRRAGRLSQNSGHEAARAGLEAMHTGPGELWTCVPGLLRAIENIVRTMPRGRASTLAVLTRGVFEDSEELPARSIGCTVGREDMRETERVIAAAQVTVLFVAVSHVDRSWGLDTVAVNTAGRGGVVTWQDPRALARLIEATRPFYRATFAADPAPPRAPQRVDLSVRRRGVRITTSPWLGLQPEP